MQSVNRQLNKPSLWVIYILLIAFAVFFIFGGHFFGASSPSKSQDASLSQASFDFASTATFQQKLGITLNHQDVNEAESEFRRLILALIIISIIGTASLSYFIYVLSNGNNNESTDFNNPISNHVKILA